ncbi:MAG: UDP-glucose 4-epimerase GalE [Planctomycetes bacterium]|nr:UDP-glucose 4-epimerase GalE [Planctomycetota bacterium]
MIVVTGGAGYIGSHTVKSLLARREPIVVLDDLSEGHRDAVLGGKLETIDLGDREAVREIFHREPIEAVIHFAALCSVPDSVRDPDRYFRANVENTLHLLSAMVETHVRFFIFSSSAATYGTPERTPIAEDHRCAPINPYGLTKLQVEDALRWYGESHGLRSVSLRYFNAAGADPDGDLGEDHRPEGHLVPLLLRAAIGRVPRVSLFGDDYVTPDGTCIRDYVHVTDLADAHCLALDALRRGGDGGVFNLGNGAGYSVRSVVAAAERVVGKPIPTQIAPRRPGDPPVLVASSDRAARELGWKPKFADLDVIVSTAWNWIREHPDGYDN